MARTTFDALPADARLWIFAAERDLAPQERDYLLDTVDAFLDQWAAHGHPLTNARELRHNRFLLIGVDERAAGASGCSIDALVRDIKRVEASLGIALVDHGPVLFREGDRIARVPRDAFSDLARAGTVTPQTVVFNNTLTRVGDVRAGRWEVPASQSWHAAAFF
jgi:hypothetical protein